MGTATGRGISRRTLAKGVAWTAPVIVIGSAAPAFAASTGNVTGVVCRIVRGPDPSHYNNILQDVYFGWSGVPGETLPTGTSTTFTIRIEQTLSSGANPGSPNITWGNYFTGTLSTAVAVTPSSGYATAYEYTYTITNTAPLTIGADGTVCGPYLVWDADNSVRPSTYQLGTSTTEYNNTVFTVIGRGSSPGAGWSTVTWDVGGTFGGTNDNYWRPLSFISTTGYPTSRARPQVGFTAGVNASAANYCLSDSKSTWATTCYRCPTNNFPDLCLPGACAPSSSCVAQNCTGSNCR